MRRSHLLGIVAGLVPLVASACSPLQAVEQRALVVAIALDAGPGPGTVAVTTQWYTSTPKTALSNDVMPETQSAVASSTAAALREVGAETHSRLDFGIVNMILVGNALASRGVRGPVDPLFRNGDLPETAQVAVVKEQASALLTHPPTNEQGYLLFRRYAEALYDNETAEPIPLWKFLSRVDNPGVDAWAPLLVPVAARYRDVGLAAFHDDRMVASIERPLATALGWLLKPGGYGDLDVSAIVSGGEPVALRVITRTVSVGCWAGRPRIRLALKTRIREGAGLRVRDRNIAPLEELAADAARDQVGSALTTLARKRADLLGLGRLACAHAGHGRQSTDLTVRVIVYSDEREA